MKLLSCIIRKRQTDKTFPAKDGKPATRIFVFDAFETDFDGARVPCTLETYNVDVCDFLENQQIDNPIYIPFSSEREWQGKYQYTVSKDVLHPSLNQ
jgi:hypothetical protein